MTNIRLAKEIYGTPWFMDPVSVQQLTGLLAIIKADQNPKEETEKANTCQLFELQDQVITTTQIWIPAEDENPDNEYIAVTRIDGPITKYGGMSSYGMVDLAAKFQRFDMMENVIGHIIIAESGGGSANAVPIMTEVINNSQKPVVTFVDDIAASAMYYIASYSDYIISKQKDAYVGSIGTMIEFAGYPKVSEDKQDGLRMVRIYADQAVNKNRMFEEAINNLNFEPIKEKMLNPHNEIFINDVKNNRANVREIELTGEIFEAQEVVGTLIDAIGTFEDAVNKVIELSNNNNINSENMTKDELKLKHPDIYNEVRQEGTIAERDRVEAYMEFVDIDAESVKKNISKGVEPSQKFYAEMTRKGMAKKQLDDIEEDAPDTVETSKKETETDPKIEAFEKEVLKSANVKTKEVQS